MINNFYLDKLQDKQTSFFLKADRDKNIRYANDIYLVKDSLENIVREHIINKKIDTDTKIYSNPDYTLREFLQNFVFKNRTDKAKIWNPHATFNLIHNYRIKYKYN